MTLIHLIAGYDFSTSKHTDKTASSYQSTKGLWTSACVWEYNLYNNILCAGVDCKKKDHF